MMESTKIMDRLVCGDVGYGKTEVALRAALRGAGEPAGVYLAPTTILAQQGVQHLCPENEGVSGARGSALPHSVHCPAEKDLQDLKKGQVDVVIGTHRVLSKDVEYKNLGF